MAVKDIFESVLKFDEPGVMALVKAEIDSGTDTGVILNQGLISSMDEVGKKFSDGDLFVPEMLRAAMAMKAGLEILKPYLSDGQATSKGTIVIGTVKGDLHDIGKNLVSMMMEGAGFNVIDLGVNVDADKFVQTAAEKGAKIVALSALLTTTMPAMQTTISAIKNAGMGVKIVVGGAPVSQTFADQIGADGYSDDAPGAVELARKLIEA